MYAKIAIKSMQKYVVWNTTVRHKTFSKTKACTQMVWFEVRI